MLSVQELYFSYPRGAVVFEGFEWKCPAGITMMLGPNGAGKSTLLGLMATALQPDAGRFTMGDLTVPGTRDGLREWRRQVGWVPQRAVAIPGMTCKEQVAYHGWLKGLSRKDADARAVPTLERLGLGGKASHKASTLSGGQLRRLAIAGALVHDSRIIVLDEPMAGLDPGQRARFLDILAGETETAWVVSTHEADDLVEHVGHVTVLAGGELRFDGSTEHFLEYADDHQRHSRAVAAYRKLVPDEE